MTIQYTTGSPRGAALVTPAPSRRRGALDLAVVALAASLEATLVSTDARLCRAASGLVDVA